MSILPLAPKLPLTDSKIATPTQPKTTSFWALNFFLKKKLKKMRIKKKKKKEKKKKMKFRSHPLAKMGWPGGWSYPHNRSGVV
jgi:hypothetical protein